MSVDVNFTVQNVTCDINEIILSANVSVKN